MRQRLGAAVALLVHQTAGTMAVLLVYPLLGERLLKALPGIGPGLHHWLPFNVANHADGRIRGVE
jgi:ABC-2 type transport system permease protein